jgi:hypothetical protein
VATGYSGTVKITSSDSQAVLPANSVLSSGVGSFSVTLKTAGSQTITATDTVTSSITGFQNGITVSAAGAVSFVVSGFPSPVIAGTAGSVTVTAKDAYGNTATGYTGTVKITSSDSKAVLPSNYAFKASDAGVHSFSVTLKTGGTESITATDTVTSSITGVQSGIMVNAASGNYLVVSGFPSPTVAGVAHTVTVTAYDASGNVATGYSGTVKITSSDGKAVLPANAGLTGGVGSFSVTLETAGTESITATDTVTSSITGFQNGITVNHAAAVANVAISPAGSSVTAGLSETFLATASDVYGNTWDVTSSTTWSISSGAEGSWSTNVYASATAGSWTVTGTYASTAYTTDLTVNPAALDHFIFNTVAAQTVNSAFDITVTADDAYDNTVTGYSGTPILSVSTGLINPTTAGAFSSGVWTGPITLSSAGSGVTITATDGTHIGTSNSFTVRIAPTATPTPTPTSTSTSTSTPTSTPVPTSTSSATTVPATTGTGSTVDLAISGNVTSSQISNATITSYQPSKTTTVSFVITGPNGTAGFGNMTVPKTAIYYGNSPTVYIDGQQAPNQGYTQDANNFYVWFTTSFSSHQVSIQFVVSPMSPASLFGPVFAVGITVPEIISIFTVIAVRRLRREPDNA